MSKLCVLAAIMVKKMKSRILNDAELASIRKLNLDEKYYLLFKKFGRRNCKYDGHNSIKRIFYATGVESPRLVDVDYSLGGIVLCRENTRFKPTGLEDDFYFRAINHYEELIPTPDPEFIYFCGTLFSATRFFQGRDGVDGIYVLRETEHIISYDRTPIKVNRQVRVADSVNSFIAPQAILREFMLHNKKFITGYYLERAKAEQLFTLLKRQTTHFKSLDSSCVVADFDRISVLVRPSWRLAKNLKVEIFKTSKFSYPAIERTIASMCEKTFIGSFDEDSGWITRPIRRDQRSDAWNGL